ncbi:uncharacterized protein LOC115699059 [Cannabis sativa]|uniref:uncharacterized protein LOC115699059 n=1 Tax=Cannabis sativa TaxID=3483 RepID=UPI0029CA188E|nr:uncharacterized protein LOC115699059 [Cannabis sativa]
MESSVSEMQMGLVGSVGYISSHPVSHQLISDNPIPQRLESIEMQMGKNETRANETLQSDQFLTSNNQIGHMGSMLNMDQMSASFKRKAPMEPISINSSSEQLSHKRMAQPQHRPWLQQMPAPNKRTVQLETMPNSPGSLNSPTFNKKMVKMDSFSNKSGSQRTPSQKGQSARVQPPSKVSIESSESVRSKMREQLAAAFSLVNQQETKPSHNLNDCSSHDQPGDHVDPETKASHEIMYAGNKLSEQKNEDEQGDSHNILANAENGDSALTSIGDGSEFQSGNLMSYNDVSFSENFFVKDELLQGNGLSWVLESDIEMVGRKKMQNTEKEESNHEEVADKLEQTFQSPENLALKIEAELFKLFGGVNKKYKEKGRSLLFNLKDRNNPELRERVMRGEISPERLCSMTAEELASKELSEWRMAKAEELAQMVVLPDSDVDIRRLVRKTHKGEFQVEVEQDDSLPMDISGGSSSVAQSWPKGKEKEIPTSKADGDKGDLNTLSDRSASCTFTIIPSCEANDLIEGLMVDDGLKDAEFLPPIVSLDEFMESLDSEPPFDNLPLDDSERTPVSEKDDSEVGSGSKSLDLSPKDVVASSEKCDNTNTDDVSKPIDSEVDLKSSGYRVDAESRESLVDAKSKECHVSVKSRDSLVKTEKSLSPKPKGEHVWGGLVQLNISTTATVIALFKSGEKTSATEWPGFLEIKGRVRLDAFEKFLQELPLSRSRAVMVVHFLVKDQSSENEIAAVKEVADSYIVDERVGFAEPASGVELYFCPPHNKTVEKLGKIVQKEHIEALNAIDNGLIGVIVWRKLSTTSPKSSSHHKHTSKKQHVTSRRHQDSSLNSNFTHKQALSRDVATPNSRRLPTDDNDDDEDDVPPGFGPPTARGDEDDLPEFNFSGGSNQPRPNISARNPSRGLVPVPYHPLNTCPVEQVRELIHKYGKNSASAIPPGNWKEKGVSGVSVQHWNDDDDDIPEWQPQGPTQQVQNFQQPMLRPHIPNQPHFGLVPLQPAHQAMQPPMNGSENMALWQQQQQPQQQGTWWVPPSPGSGIRPSNIGCQPDVGQMYGATGRGIVNQPGMVWQQNTPKSRGF